MEDIMQVIQFTPGKQLFLARCARQPVNEGKNILSQLQSVGIPV